jgi:DNA-binding response OmpR family regulator
LLKQPDHFVDRDSIVRHALGEEPSNPRAEENRISSMVYRLRKKLGEDANHPRYLISVKNRGVKLVLPKPERATEP